MFGSKESAAPQGATTLIAPGARVEGDLQFSGCLEIEGTVIGNIRSEEKGAGVRVLNGGLLEGEIWVGDVIVNGHVRGNIHASNLVKLASKAVIEGNIHYSLIEVEKGAEVMGNFVLEQPINNVSAFPKDNSVADG